MLRRCRLEGPFNNKRFPAFTSDYPLLQLGEKERSPRKEPETNQGVVHKGPRSSLNRRKQKNSVRVAGSVKLRIGVTGSTSPVGSRVAVSDGKVADSSAVGDDDSPEISRRRTNTVDRRLRLGVGWVSLARLFGRAPSSVVSPTHKVAEVNEVSAADDRSAAERSGDIGARQLPQSQQLSKEHRRRSGSEQAESKPADAGRTVGRFCSLLPMPMSGISCRVTWCGVCVASFELCPKTGLPLTPGECLLELPRGTAWSSCRLVLELIAMDECLKHPGMEEALDHWRRLHSLYDLGGVSSTSHAENGPDNVLGRVTVGWQVSGDGKGKMYEFLYLLRDSSRGSRWSSMLPHASLFYVLGTLL